MERGYSSYFRVMSIPVIHGQTFQPGSHPSGAHPVIVNRTFARYYLADRDPLGCTFLWGENKAPYVIAAIVEDTKNMTIGEDDQAQLYEDLAQIDNDSTRIQFVLRSATPPGTQLRAVHDTMRHIDPNAGLEVATLYSSIGFAFLPSQVGAALLGGIGAIGLLLAAIGLYGIMAYTVARRTREIGVRMALGAEKRDIIRMVLTGSAKLVGTGGAIGLFAAFYVTRPFAMFLVPGLYPTDPVSFLASALLLGMTGLLAASGPARRAAAVDPINSLRYE
jgi:ABC-type antimicrobial peptide transport system permease subunit